MPKVWQALIRTFASVLMVPLVMRAIKVFTSVVVRVRLASSVATSNRTIGSYSLNAVINWDTV